MGTARDTRALASSGLAMVLTTNCTHGALLKLERVLRHLLERLERSAGDLVATPERLALDGGARLPVASAEGYELAPSRVQALLLALAEACHIPKLFPVAALATLLHQS